MFNLILDRCCKVLEAAIAFCLALMVVLVFGNVVMRYGFNSGITVSEELSRWLFVWLTFMGAIVAMKDGAHLGSDTLVSRLPLVGKNVDRSISFCKNNETLQYELDSLDPLGRKKCKIKDNSWKTTKTIQTLLDEFSLDEVSHNS